jgi:hypothetical protein
LESREIDQPLTIGKEMVALRFLYRSYRVPSSSMYKLSAMASAHSRVKQIAFSWFFVKGKEEGEITAAADGGNMSRDPPSSEWDLAALALLLQDGTHRGQHPPGRR